MQPGMMDTDMGMTDFMRRSGRAPSARSPLTKAAPAPILTNGDATLPTNAPAPIARPVDPNDDWEDPNNVFGFNGRSAGTPAARPRPGAPPTPPSGMFGGGGVAGVINRMRQAHPPTAGAVGNALRATHGLVTPKTGVGAVQPGMPPAPPPAPGAATGVTSIDPTNDLRSKQITSDENPDVVGRAQQLEDQTMAGYGNTDVSAGDDVDPIASARLGRYGSMMDENLGKLANVDRVQLAKDALARFDEEQLPEHELALRKLTEKYGARGGARSGQLRTSYGDEDLARQRDRDLMKKRLIDEAVSGSVEDQFRKTGAIQGAESGLAEREAMYRGEQRGERAYKGAVQEGNIGRRISTRQAAQARGSQLAGTEQEARRYRTNDLRGERDYQNAMEGQAFNRRLAQHQIERGDQSTDFEHALQMLDAGEAGNPSAVLARLSESGIDPATIAQIASSFGSRGARTPTAAPARKPASTPINPGDVLNNIEF